jgi:Zn-dependent protease with chaperone function
VIIGLPAASELTTTEFTSLLAHELGHFTQKLGMRLYYIITSIQGWFYRLIFEEDEIDQKLAILSMTSSGFVRWFVIPAANLSVWLSRKILTAFMLAGNVISEFYIRQMEFDADRYAVRLSGHEAFESSLSKLHLLNMALKEAFSQLKMQKRPADNSLPNDFVLLVSSIMKQSPAGDTSKAKEAGLKNLTGIPDKNPTDRERIEQVKGIPAKAIPQSDALASTLFTSFKDTAKITSSRLYREVLGLQFNQDSLVPTDEFVGTSGPAPEMTENITEIENNFF